jgi:hypothetical protein
MEPSRRVDRRWISRWECASSTNPVDLADAVAAVDAVGVVAVETVAKRLTCKHTTQQGCGANNARRMHTRVVGAVLIQPLRVYARA